MIITEIILFYFYIINKNINIDNVLIYNSK